MVEFAHQLTPRQRRVLDFMKRESPTHARRVAGEFGWRSQDAGRVIKALERKGLVEFYFSGTAYEPSGYRPVAS